MGNTERSAQLQEREKTHGSFVANSLIWQRYMRVACNTNMHPSQELAVSMIFLKIARLMSGNPNNRDHWKDIAGYAELGAEACD